MDVEIHSPNGAKADDAGKKVLFEARARAKLPSIEPSVDESGRLYVAFPTLTEPRPVPPRVLSRCTCLPICA